MSQRVHGVRVPGIRIASYGVNIKTAEKDPQGVDRVVSVLVSKGMPLRDF